MHCGKPCHSITSSAIASSVGGTVRPGATQRAWRNSCICLCRGPGRVTDVAIEEAGDWPKRPRHVVWIDLRTQRRVPCNASVATLLMRVGGTHSRVTVGAEEPR
jgi:hypothetical protein